MKKKITGLLAIFMLAGWTGMTNAATVVIDGFGADSGVYEIELVACTFHACPTDSSLLTSQNWWGNRPLATALVDDIQLSGFGVVNGDFGGSGPYFAVARNGSGLSTEVVAYLGFGLGTSNTTAVDGLFYNYALTTSFTPAVVPLPAAGFLFITAVVGLFGSKRFTRNT